MNSKKDLTQLSKEIEALVMKHFDLKDRPALAIAFTLPPEYLEVRWVTNVSRRDGIELLEGTAEKMRSQLN